MKTFGGFTSSVAAVMRVTDGVTLEELEQETKGLYYQGAEAASPQFTKHIAPFPRIAILSDEIRGDSQKMAVMLIAGVVLLMFMALVNLGNVQMARAVGRVQPLAISYAFGASRRQIFIEIFKHNALVVGLATVFSLCLTQVVVLIARFAAQFFPRMDTLGISSSMLVLSVCVVVFIACLFSLIEMQSCKVH